MQIPVRRLHSAVLCDILPLRMARGHRCILTVVLLLFCVFGVSAVEYESSLFAPDPAVMGQGGAAVATASGFTALLANPAGFVGAPGELTILGARSWVHSSPSRAPDVAQLLLSDRKRSTDSDTYRQLERDFRKNGLGAGGALGIGYVGRGLGLGFHAALDSFLQGKSFAKGNGTLTTELSLIGGLAFPFELGPVRLHLGAAVRPLVRVHSIVDAEQTPGAAAALVQHFLGLQTGYDGEDYAGELTETYHGYGVAIDTGLQLLWNAWRVGFAVRDVGDTALTYSQANLRTVIDELRGGALPPGAGEEEEGYVEPGSRKLPMRATVGLGFEPELGGLGGRVDPRFQLELDDVFGRVSPDLPLASRTNVGAEMLLWRRLALRTGLHQGYLTAGAGVDLPGLEFNVALFSREIGDGFRDQKSSSIALELALRF